MLYIQELADLITVRNFLISADENVQCKLSKADSVALRAKVSDIDKAIVERSLKLDTSIERSVVKTFTSTVDVDKVMEAVDNIVVDEQSGPQATKEAKKQKYKIVKHG